jgi:hypothetical protein
MISATLLNNGSVVLGAANGLRPLLEEILPEPEGAEINLVAGVVTR